MWVVRGIEVLRAVLDFTSSGQEPRSVRQVFLDERLDHLDRRLEALTDRAGPATLVEDPGPRPVTFYLATAPIHEWSPLAEVGGRLGLHFEPGLVFAWDEI